MIFFKRVFKQKQEQKETEERQKKIESERQKKIESERHILPIVLVQKLVKVYIQNSENLVIKYGNFDGWNPCNYVRVSTKDGKFIYQVLHQKEEPYNYWVEVGPKGCVFGLYSEDNSLFKDENNNNYLGALYQFYHVNPHCNDFLEISELMSKKFQIDLNNANAWSSSRMAVFPFLDGFLSHNK